MCCEDNSVCCVVLTWGAWGMGHAGVCHSPCSPWQGQLRRQLPWHACHSCELLLPVTCDRKMLRVLHLMLTSVLVNDQHTGTDSFAMVSSCAQLATTLQWFLHSRCGCTWHTEQYSARFCRSIGLLCQPEYACRHNHAKVLAEQWLSTIRIDPHACRQ